MEPLANNDTHYTPDSWRSLRAFTAARIALGRTGTAVPLKENLHFRQAHAHARDAVYSTLDIEKLIAGTEALGVNTVCVQSQVPNREVYLKRPDLGRVLDNAGTDLLKEYKQLPASSVVIILADGLSATAVNNHALPVLARLLPQLRAAAVSVGPVVIATQSRVALADPIGAYLGAQLSVILIGERPGLTSPESMGAYITYNPQPGLTDEARNCISNIHPEGLPYQAAADKICYLTLTALRRQLSGVQLKDDAPPALL